jgi:hypothetical protein
LNEQIYNLWVNYDSYIENQLSKVGLSVNDLLEMKGIIDKYDCGLIPKSGEVQKLIDQYTDEYSSYSNWLNEIWSSYKSDKDQIELGQKIDSNLEERFSLPKIGD